ncbi:MAG: hypothetical protein ACQERD_09590 [Campylobacterota bacterium]
MNKIVNISLAAVAAFTLTACTKSPTTPTIETSANVDVKKVCDVKSNGIKNVLETAKTYNEVAKKEDLEFMRLGMKTSQYISGAQNALKTGAKNVDVINKSMKKTGEVTKEYAAWRACSFAIRALQQAQNAKTNWKLAAPGHGYKY